MTETKANQGLPPVLIVEDDPDIASGLTRGLESHGYKAVWTDRVDEAQSLLAQGSFAAAIVDVMIGPDNGLDLVTQVRENGLVLPIIVLSALDTVEDRTAGIEAGADDYIVKPFSFAELVARLKVQEKRAETRMPAVPMLDADKKSVMSVDGPVSLTSREFQLLETLSGRFGEAITRGELFDTLWADEGSSSENVVDVYVGYLRKKLKPAEAFPFEIKTVRHKGFMVSER